MKMSAGLKLINHPTNNAFYRAHIILQKQFVVIITIITKGNQWRKVDRRSN